MRRLVAQTALAGLLKLPAGRPFAADVRGILERTPLGAAASAISAILFAAAAAREMPTQGLAAWLSGSLALFAVLWLRSRRALRLRENLPRRLSLRGARRLSCIAALFALPWAAMVAMTVGAGPFDTAETLALLIAVGACAGGAFMLHRAPRSVAVYVSVILATIVAATLVRDEGRLWPVALLSPVFGVFLIAVSKYMSRTASGMERSVAELSRRMSALNEANKAIRKLAFEDAVTGLPNRKAFQTRLAQLARPGGKRAALLLLDLDRFQNVNDTLGHEAGDRLLAETGARISACLEEGDMAARLGGDEFAVILRDRSSTDAARIARDIMNRVSEPVRLGDETVHTGASIGLARYPEDAPDAETLMARADNALNRAKEAGRGLLLPYRSEMGDRIAEDNRLEAALREALLRGGLEMRYQPKCCLRTGRQVGAEALLRWRHATLGWVAPDRLLEIAEKRGLLSKVSSFVIERVTDDILGWKARGVRTGPIAINIHPADLKAPHFLMDRLKRMVARGVSPADVVLEITEGCVVGKGADEASLILDALDEMGFELSLDDFGTGHASLSHLKRVPVGELKIDREFVAGLENGRADRAIVAAALEISRFMSIRCIAEGVETPEQAAALSAMGAEIGQGYLWAPALPASELARFAAGEREEAAAAAAPGA